MNNKVLIGSIVVMLVLKIHRVNAAARPVECVLKDYDEKFQGTTSVTKSGKTCQRWDSQTPHSHFTTKQDLPEASLKGAENYCRITGGDRAPWCYTTDPATEREECWIPYCTAGMECKYTDEGSEYTGTVNTAVANGKTYTCQRWDSQAPHTHTNTKPNMENFHEKTMAEVSNYCRNYKATESGPWCLPTDKNEFQVSCSVPKCPTKALCGAQPAIENGRSVEPPSNAKYDLGFSITYVCDDGYELEDKYDAVLCMLNGSWTRAPKCLPGKCPDVTVNNGKAESTEPKFRVGSTVTVTCDPGYALSSGDGKLNCQKDKTWSAPIPSCITANCGYAPVIGDATLLSLTAIGVGGKASYKCSKDGKTYEMECKDTLKWQGETGACTDVVTAGGTTSTQRANTSTLANLAPFFKAHESDAFIAGLCVGIIILVAAIIGIAVWLAKVRPTKFKARKRLVRPESRGSSGYDSTEG